MAGSGVDVESGMTGSGDPETVTGYVWGPALASPLLRLTTTATTAITTTTAAMTRPTVTPLNERLEAERGGTFRVARAPAALLDTEAPGGGGFRGAGFFDLVLTGRSPGAAR